MCELLNMGRAGLAPIPSLCFSMPVLKKLKSIFRPPSSESLGPSGSSRGGARPETTPVKDDAASDTSNTDKPMFVDSISHLIGQSPALVHLLEAG